MKKLFIFALCLLPLIAACACAPAAPAPAPAPSAAPLPASAPTPEPQPEYRYISAQELYSQLESGETPLIIDLQPAVYYGSSGHLSGAVSTEAYPADSSELTAKLDAQLSAAQAASSVILVDMGGKAGAQNAFEHFAASGVDLQKLAILDGGMIAWPYDELVEVDPGEYDYQYMSAKELRSTLRHEEPILLIDLRGSEEYSAAHLKQSISIPAFLPNADENVIRAALTASIEISKSSGAPKILLITATGGLDAQNAYDFYARHGVAPQTLYILEEGITGWPEDYERYIIRAELEDAPAPLIPDEAGLLPALVLPEAESEETAGIAPAAQVPEQIMG